MNLLDKRTDHQDQILKGIFVRQQLQEEAKEIDDAQTSLMVQRGFNSRDFFSGRGFSVQDEALRYDHLKKHRFVDMRKRNNLKKKSHPIHNRILFGHANNIIRRLSFGYTEAVKQDMEELRQKLNIN